MLAILQARGHGGCSHMRCLGQSKRPDVHVLVQSLLPVFDQTQEGGLTAIGGSEGRKVIMEDGVEMITQLLAKKTFINFRECWQHADSFVFKEGVIFFKYWCYLGHFELGWEFFFGLHLVGHFGNIP